MCQEKITTQFDVKMKIFINNVQEGWIVDRFRKEFYEYNPEVSTSKIREADLVWIISPWAWRKIPKKHLRKKKVICTVHHIDEIKFSGIEGKEFFELDKFVDFYHTISEKSFAQLSKLTKKPIFKIPFWVNPNLWFQLKDKDNLKKKHSIPLDVKTIGSFQRDTEGKDGVSPKLSKGPDQLFTIIKKFAENENILVILSGHRRNYITSLFDKSKINYIYFEQVNTKTLNELYNCLDLYIVASRIEGGPQAIFESALTRTPIISTDVGAAGQFLSKKSIYNMENFQLAETDTELAYDNVIKLAIPSGFNSFLNIFEDIV
ncbi:glycosyltransferase [Acidimicrobiia bacterium]|jgi:hypothetical protein|nr:glycosyltransferase [Acidimicrobiia bacterium]